MGSLILLIVAAIWIAVLVPPLLRSRLENRPNSSVSDFRDQLSSLQKAVPTTRAGSMRSMARPLAPSALARPAAPGRPLRSGVTLASGGSTRSPRQQAALRPVVENPRTSDPVRRARVSDPPARRHGSMASMSEREALKRRRANVLFVLGVIAACSVFLAVTTKTTGVAWVAGIACISLVGYVFLLAQQANMARPVDRARRDAPAPRRHGPTDATTPRRRPSEPAPRRRPQRDAWDARDERPEEWDEEMWAPRPRPARRPSASSVARTTHDELSARRRQPARPRGWSEDPRPSGVVYGDPLFMSREQPIVRRERPNTRRRQPEWSPAV